MKTPHPSSTTVTVEALPDPQAYAQAADAFLQRRTVANGVPLSVLNALLQDPSRYPERLLLVARRKGAVVGSAHWTPPHPFFPVADPSAVPDVAGAFASFLAARGVRPAGVVGETATAEAFDAAWRRATGALAARRMDQGLFRLTEVEWPKGPRPGVLRNAQVGEVAFLGTWIQAFCEELALPTSSEGALRAAERFQASGGLFVLEVEGRLVSMAVAIANTADSVRIGYVYTPKALRGRGYASWTVAHVSETKLSEGNHFCMLYTDLANPTSNKIYQALGYERAGSSAHISYVAPEPSR